MPLALAMAALGLIALVLLSRSSGDTLLTPGEEDNRFYLEATIVVLGPVSADGARPEESNSTVQWWYVRPGVWRWQLDVESPTEDPRTLLGVADAKDVWTYESVDNTYTRVSLKTNPYPGLPLSLFLGPLDVDELVARWESSDISVRSGGSNRFMGRDAQVLEYSPTWRSSESGVDRSGGIGRIWIDDETGLIVRNLVDGGASNQYMDGRVTLLELEPHFDVNTFHFEVPNGATRVEPE